MKVMIRFILGLGTVIAGVGFIEGSNSFAIGIPIMVVGAMVMLWALTSAQLTE
jgi:hypothetical protein